MTQMQAEVKEACSKQRKIAGVAGIGHQEQMLVPLHTIRVQVPARIAQSLAASDAAAECGILHNQQGQLALVLAAMKREKSTHLFLQDLQNTSCPPEISTLLPAALQSRCCRLVACTDQASLAAPAASAAAHDDARADMLIVVWATVRVLQPIGISGRLAPAAWRALLQPVSTHRESLLMRSAAGHVQDSAATSGILHMASSSALPVDEDGADAAFEEVDPLTQWQVYAAAAPRFKSPADNAPLPPATVGTQEAAWMRASMLSVRGSLAPSTQLRAYQTQGLQWILRREGHAVHGDMRPDTALAATYVRMAWPLQRCSAVAASAAAAAAQGQLHPGTEAALQGGVLQLFVCLHTGWVSLNAPISSTHASGAWGGGGILADEMGLGKTLLALALCSAQPHPDTPLSKRHSEAAKLWDCLSGKSAESLAQRQALSSASKAWPSATAEEATGVAARKATRKVAWQYRTVRLKLGGGALLLRPRALMPAGWRPVTAGSAGAKCAITGLAGDRVSPLCRMQQCGACSRHVSTMAIPAATQQHPVCLACHGRIAQHSAAAAAMLSSAVDTSEPAAAAAGAARASTPSTGEHPYLPSACTLIVCPDQLLPQWLGEMRKHLATVRVHDSNGSNPTPSSTACATSGSMQVAVYPGVSGYLKHCAMLQRSAAARSSQLGSPALCMSPVFLASCHIVLTTYSALQKDLLRDPRNTRAGVLATPLLQVHWHRVVLDEAQMVDVPTSRSAKMARLLACNHRWGMSGTPLLRGVEDFRGLCRFLGLQPFDSAAALQSLTAPSSAAAHIAGVWRQREEAQPMRSSATASSATGGTGDSSAAAESLDVQQFALEEHLSSSRPDQLALLPGGCAGVWPTAPPAHRFLSCVSDIMWRNTQADVLQQLDLPDRYEDTIQVRLFPAEQQAYERLFREAQRRVSGVLRKWRVEGAADPSSLQAQLTSSEAGGLLGEALLQVRQMACHVSATSGVNWLRGQGSGGAGKKAKGGSALGDAMTQEELVDSLVEKAQNDCEQAQREWAYALNGLAGLACIYGDRSRARSLYQQVLHTAAQRSDKYSYRLDAGQRVHALQNLRRLLTGGVQEGAAAAAAGSDAPLADQGLGDVPEQVQDAAKQYTGERQARTQQAAVELLACSLHASRVAAAVGGRCATGPADAKRTVRDALAMGRGDSTSVELSRLYARVAGRTVGEDITAGHSLPQGTTALMAAVGPAAENEADLPAHGDDDASPNPPSAPIVALRCMLHSTLALGQQLGKHAVSLLQACMHAATAAELDARMEEASKDAAQRTAIRAARAKRDLRLDTLEAAAASGGSGAQAELAAAQARAESAVQREEVFMSAAQPPYVHLAQSLLRTVSSVGSLPAYVKQLTVWAGLQETQLKGQLLDSTMKLQSARTAAFDGIIRCLTPSPADLAAAGLCEQCRGGRQGVLCSLCKHRRSLEQYRACFWVRNSDDGSTDKRIRPSSVQAMQSLGSTGGAVDSLVSELARGKRKRTRAQQGILGIAAGDAQTDTALVRVSRHLAGCRGGVHFYREAAGAGAAGSIGGSGGSVVTLPRALEALREEAEALLVLWQHNKDFLSSVDEFSQFSLRMSLVAPDTEGAQVVLSGNVPFQELPEELLLPSSLPTLRDVQPMPDSLRPHARPVPAVEGALLAKAAATAIPANYLWPWDITAREGHFQDTLQAAEADLRTFNYRLLHTRQLKRDLHAAVAAAGALAPAASGAQAVEAAGSECPICLQNIFGKALCVLPCAHKLCRQCTNTALKMHGGSYKCPLCKTAFNRSQVTLIDTTKRVTMSATPGSAAQGVEVEQLAASQAADAAAPAATHSAEQAADEQEQQHATECRLLRKGKWQSVPRSEASQCAAQVAAQLARGSSDLLRGSIVGSSALGGKLSSIVYFMQQLVHTAADRGHYCRVLVFSQWDVLLRILGSGLEANGVPCMRVAGAKDLPSTLAAWQQSSMHPALLLPTRVGNSGLNITEANHVVFVEPLMVHSVQAQAVGRVHRGGQSRTTYVHRFVTSGTVEPSVAAAGAAQTAQSSGGRGSALSRQQAMHVLSSDLKP